MSIGEVLTDEYLKWDYICKLCKQAKIEHFVVKDGKGNVLTEKDFPRDGWVYIEEVDAKDLKDRNETKDVERDVLIDVIKEFLEI